MQATIDLDWSTDAAKAIGRGYGGHYSSHWFHGLWNEKFLSDKDPSIEFLELYAVAIGVLLWLRNHKTKG